MIIKIISILINLAFNYLQDSNKEQLKTKLEAILARQKSIKDSYGEQERARKAAENAKQNIEKQGSDDDIFGSETY